MSLLPEGFSLFVIDIEYLAPLEKIDEHRDDHIKFLEQYYESKHFLASGPKVPRTGGVIWAVAPSKEGLQEIFREDPFQVHGLAQYDITEFSPTIMAKSTIPVSE